MLARVTVAAGAAFLALALILALTSPGVTRAGVLAPAADDGVVRVRSAYAMDETVSRLKQDIAQKGIVFFLAVDQSRLAREAGIELSPSTLLIFGNPALGSHFITAKPEAGLDWPVRLLVSEDDSGQVWVIYNDFGWIARRHRIASRDAEFTMASKVIASITASVAAQ
jgi:uncharacterized protein (DUF302 family)